MKKGTTILLLALLAVVCLAVSCKNDPPPHVHTYNMTSWEKDDDNHWHKATCEHKEEVKDKAEHTWDEGEVTTPAQPGIEGVKTYTCTACGIKRPGSIDAPPMPSGSIKFVDHYTLDKTYSNEPIPIDKSKVVRLVDDVWTPIDNQDAISFLFKKYDADDSTYKAEAPIKPGHYKVKVIVAASLEWTEKEYEQGFYIDKIKLSGDYDLKNSLVYKGESHLISELILTHANLPCILEGETVVIKDIKTNKNEGRIEVDSYKIVENEYYEDLDLPEFKLYATVNPFNISADINITKVYDGTVNAEFTGWGATIPEADRGKLKLTVTTDGKDVGTHSPANGLPVVFYLDGASTNNYTIDKSKIKINVTAKALTFVTPPTKVFDGSNTIINVEKENLVGIANEENISVEIDTKKSDVINPTQTPTGYSYVIKDNGNITKNYTITDNELHKARIVAKEVDFLPSYSFGVVYDKVKKLNLACEILFGKELKGYYLVVNYKNENAGSAYDSHYFEKGSTTSYNYKLTSDAERIVTTSTIQKSKLELTQTAYNIQDSSSKSCYFVLYDKVEKEQRAIKCTYGSSTRLSNATFEPGNNYEVVVPNNAKLIFQNISGNYEMNVGETKVFAAESGKYIRDIKLNGVVEGTQYSIIVTCSSSAGSYSAQRKTVFSVDSSGITIQRLPNQNQTQTDYFTATGSGTYYLRISNLDSSTSSTVTIQKFK